MSAASQHQTRSALSAIARAMFESEYAELQEIINNDPVEIKLPSEDGKILPPQFLELAHKLHRNYLYWKHLRDRQQTTQPTFYRYTQAGITQAADKVATTGTPIEPESLLVLETRIALITINSLLLSAEDYLAENHLQDAKESVDTALSTLYELIKTREKLEPSLEAAIASIQHELVNESESHQYASYVATQILRLQDSSRVKEPKLYVVRHQLEKLGKTLILLIPGDLNTYLPRSGRKKKIDALLVRLLFSMVKEEVYTTTIEHQDGGVENVLFSPNGAYLTTISATTVKLIEVSTSRILTLRQKSIQKVHFSPKGTYLAIRIGYNTLKLVEVVTGREITTIEDFWDIIFSPDDTYLVIALEDKTAKLIEVATGQAITTIKHGGEIDDISFSLDGAYLASKTYNMTQLLKVKPCREVKISPEGNWIVSVLFSPNSAYLATFLSDQTVKLLEAKTEKEITTIKSQDNVLFSPNSNYILTQVKVIEVATGEEVTTIPHERGVSPVLFSPNSAYLAIGCLDDTIKLVKVSTGKTAIAIEQRNSVRNILFSPNSAYLAMNFWRDNTIKLVEVATAREVTTIRHGGSIKDILFSSDGSYLVTRSWDKTAKLVETATGEEVTAIHDRGGIHGVLFSPNSTYLAVRLYTTVKLFETVTGKEVNTIRHQDEVKDIAFSPDGTYLVTASRDKTVKLVNLDKLLQIINEAENYSEKALPQASSLVQMNKPESFFLTWLRAASNRHSFYEYMLAQARKEREGLSVRYRLPILETNLLLESLGFLLLNAEKHYHQVYPTLIDTDENEISLIAIQDLKQSVAASLSSIYEFLYHRMELDEEDYNQAIERFKQEVEEKVENSELLLKLFQKIKSILQLEGIQNRGEFQTIKDMLVETNNIVKELLPDRNPGTPQIPLNQDTKKVIDIINDPGTKELDIIPLLLHINHLGLLDSNAVRTAISRLGPRNVVKLLKLLPQEFIEKRVALAAIQRCKTTRSIRRITPFTDISNKETLLKILEAAPRKNSGASHFGKSIKWKADH